MQTVTLIGYLATVCSMTSFAPQAWKIIKTRDTSSISAPMYALTVLGFALWLAFGLLALSSTPALHAFGLTLLVGIALVWAASAWLRKPSQGALA